MNRGMRESSWGRCRCSTHRGFTVGRWISEQRNACIDPMMFPLSLAACSRVVPGGSPDEGFSNRIQVCWVHVMARVLCYRTDALVVEGTQGIIYEKGGRH